MPCFPFPPSRVFTEPVIIVLVILETRIPVLLQYDPRKLNRKHRSISGLISLSNKGQTYFAGWLSQEGVVVGVVSSTVQNLGSNTVVPQNTGCPRVLCLFIFVSFRT
jgi:hypothetical protein